MVRENGSAGAHLAAVATGNASKFMTIRDTWIEVVLPALTALARIKKKRWTRSGGRSLLHRELVLG
jgi:hypothetical protein